MGNLMPFVVFVSGKINSGKTTFSRELSNKLGCLHVSFGDFVRETATDRGLGHSREVLQNLGESLIAEGWRAFCESTLKHGKWTKGRPVVIDGIRHIRAIQELKEIIGLVQYVHVHVEVNKAIREDRIIDDELSTQANFQKIDMHSTELESDLLRERATIVINGSESVVSNIEQVCSRITL